MVRGIVLALVAIGGWPLAAAAFDRSTDRPADLPCNAFCRLWMRQPDPAPPAHEAAPGPPLELPSASTGPAGPPAADPPPVALDRPPRPKRKIARRPPRSPRPDLAAERPPAVPGRPTPGPAPVPAPSPLAARASPAAAAPQVAATPAEGAADPVLRSRINWVRTLNAGLGHAPLPSDHAGAERRAIEDDLRQLGAEAP